MPEGEGEGEGCGLLLILMEEMGEGAMEDEEEEIWGGCKLKMGGFWWCLACFLCLIMPAFIYQQRCEGK
jgi:hypothetical protein